MDTVITQQLDVMLCITQCILYMCNTSQSMFIDVVLSTATHFSFTDASHRNIFSTAVSVIAVLIQSVRGNQKLYIVLKIQGAP